MLTVNDVFAIIEPKFNKSFHFEKFQDDDDLFDAFDSFMFSLVEDGEFDGYDIIRAEWADSNEAMFHFTVDGCKKIIVLNCKTEANTIN